MDENTEPQQPQPTNEPIDMDTSAQEEMYRSFGCRMASDQRAADLEAQLLMLKQQEKLKQKASEDPGIRKGMPGRVKNPTGESAFDTLTLRPTISFGRAMTRPPSTVHRDQTERAFRRFEPELSEACNHLAHNPDDYCEISMGRYSMSAETFVNRIRSASTGYRKFGYTSATMPKGFNVAWISFAATLNSVIIMVRPSHRHFVREAFGPKPTSTNDSSPSA